MKQHPKTFTRLSRAADHRFPGKEYKVVSLPEGMEITGNGFSVTGTVPTIAVIDGFRSLDRVKIGRGVKVPHGQIVTQYAVNGLEDRAGVLALGIAPRNGRSSMKDLKAVKEALADLAALQKAHHNILALNLSVGTSCSDETLEHDLMEVFSGNRICQYSSRKALRKALLQRLEKAGGKKRVYRYAREMIASINQLVEEGTLVYSSSGNMGDEGIDLLTLSRAQRIVSASDYDKANRRFSNCQKEGIHLFTRQYYETGHLKAITDGIIRFAPEQLPGGSRKRNWIDRLIPDKGHSIRGTSYACPLKLNEDMRHLLEDGSAEKTNRGL